ncbi:MAG TPA: type II toxin-antitoxin system HicB family antitoxin [Anaerolineales bacterium]|jgi:predicted RNase H-like HicB family nuclease|nr:type II toxin-antitoxin system HicB family antitoxin [Anaerolineales bacterium]
MDTRAKAETLAKLPYIVTTAIEESTDNQPIYFARVLEIEGCFGQGETREAAIEDLRLAMVDFIESLLEDGLPVPEPSQLFTPTLGTATQGTFTFLKQGKNLQPKRSETYRDEYFLLAHAGQ